MPPETRISCALVHSKNCSQVSRWRQRLARLCFAFGYGPSEFGGDSQIQGI